MNLFPEDPPAYRVLARKYRPADFSALIGQEAMVRTLANAIRTGRLAQAWLLTGVRGVGKTSTARIIARCLNCTGPDGRGGPTVTPCGVCDACVQIAAGQHIDVIEMDAASNTGVDDVREIIEAVRYASVSARYKVYIIDEVHMLSKSAFNALLKTLEEPPPHVKFVLATTEIDKVPSTILSRCQRFDLRRVPVAKLEAHFAEVAKAEGVEVEAEALHLIARAAEGSVRDGLSILDQAIAMAGGRVGAELVRDLLGLAGRGRVARLFAAIVAADAGQALAELDQAHAAGVEPLALFRSLLELVHMLTRARCGGVLDPALAEADRALLVPILERIDFPALHRLWQLLLKGHQEIGIAPNPAEAAAMAVLRAVHAAGMPGPEELVAMLAGGAATAPAPAAPAGAPPPKDFPALVRLFAANGEPLLARQLNDKVACAGFNADKGVTTVVLQPLGDLPQGFARAVAERLEQWTGARWEIQLETDRARGASLLDLERARAEAARDEALADPTVRALLEAFPGSAFLGVRSDAPEPDPTAELPRATPETTSEGTPESTPETTEDAA